MTTTAAPWSPKTEELTYSWTTGPMIRVRLTYFWRFSGRYISSAEYYTECATDWDIYHEVLERLREKNLPGLDMDEEMVMVMVEPHGGKPQLLNLPGE